MSEPFLERQSRTYHTFTARLPGPPLSNDTALVTLLENKVLVGVGTPDAALVAHTRLDLAWVYFIWLITFSRDSIHICSLRRQRPNRMGESRATQL